MNERLIRILLVDDEELIRSAMLAWLEDDRFLITVADSGADALNQLATQHFDCGILDLNLNDMTGVDVLTSAQYVGRKPYWLVMTGNIETGTYQDLRELGLADDDILQKPIFDMHLVTTKIMRSVAMLPKGD